MSAPGDPGRPQGGCGSDGGFSLIEVVAAVVITGLLAALATPTYMSLQAFTRESATKSDLTNDRTAIVAYGIDNNGLVPSATGFAPGTNGLNLVGYGWSQSAQTTSYRYSTDAGTPPSAWCLDMTSSTGSVFRISASTALATGTCAALGTANY